MRSILAGRPGNQRVLKRSPPPNRCHLKQPDPLTQDEARTAIPNSEVESLVRPHWVEMQFLQKAPLLLVP
jgi:hypothetical protein